MSKFDAIKKLLSKGNAGLDEQLMKMKFMRDKGPGPIAGGIDTPGLIPSQVDKKKKAALLAALGLGGAGLASMGDEDED
jgi:hypothetical protein